MNNKFHIFLIFSELFLFFMYQMVPRNHRIHRHCFTGDWNEADAWLKKFPNSYIGLTPMVTYTKGRSSGPRDVASNIPLSKLLLETDAPYFVPHRVSIMIIIIMTLQDCHPQMFILLENLLYCIV